MVRIITLWMLLKIVYPIFCSVWPISRESFRDGDVILGGIFPIHRKDNDKMCGRLQEEGIIELEAMLYTVESINNDKRILDGLKLGVLAVDSCDSVPGALQETVDFARGFMVRDDALQDNSSRLFKCQENSLPEYKNGRYNKMVAVIGGHSSWVSMQVADLMRIYKVPQVSYQSTNPLLSDKKRFKYFFRTVPSLDYQVNAIFNILKEFGWTYVSVVYADSDYGNNGFEVLKKEAQSQDICLSSHQRINVENSLDERYDSVISNLLNKKAKAVIVFSDHVMAHNLMCAATRAGAFDRFVWIGSTAWVSREYVTSGNERTMEGAIGITHVIKPLKNFNEYLKSRTLKGHREVNPWFPEYWEKKNGCKVTDFDDTPFNKNYTRNCSPNGQLQGGNYALSSPAAQFVRDAVYAVAQALDNMLRECGKECSKSINGTELREYVKNVTFEDENQETFSFDENGDGPPRYSVVSFQKNESNEEYKWVPVGNYSYFPNNGSKLELQKQAMRYKHNQSSYPESRCSAECNVGQAKIILDESICCWHCADCIEFYYVNGSSCQKCSDGTKPSATKDKCDPIASEYMDFSNRWAIACSVFSVVGIMMTLCVAALFRKFWNTPIFMVSGKELSLILLIGIFLSFCLTFAIVSKPSPLSCGIVRFYLGFCYTISYAAIATKTRLISRFCQLQAANKKPKPIKTKSLWLVTIALIAVEATINVTWLLHSHPDTDHQYPTQLENVFICKGSNSPGYLVGLVYPFVLVVFCTIYAFNIRNFTGAFYESRYIHFTNYTTVVLWLAFLPMFLLNSIHNFLRVVSLSLLLNISALVQLVCLFFPKVYIALRRPEKNRYDNVMCYDPRGSTSNVIN